MNPFASAKLSEVMAVGSELTRLLDCKLAP